MAQPRPAPEPCLSFALLNKLDSVTPNWGSMHDFSRKPCYVRLLHRHRTRRTHMHTHSHNIPFVFSHRAISTFPIFAILHYGYRLHNCARIVSNKWIFPGNVFVNFCCVHQRIHILHAYLRGRYLRERKGNGPAIREGFEKYANAYRANSYRKSTDWAFVESLLMGKKRRRAVPLAEL